MECTPDLARDVAGTIAQATALIDLGALTDELEREGVQSFCDSYHELLECIEGKLGAVTSARS